MSDDEKDIKPDLYSNLLNSQISAVSTAMQSMLKANLQVYESFQNQMTKLIEKNSEGLNATASALVSSIRQDTNQLIQDMKKIL